MSQRVRARWVGAALAAAVAFGGGAACTSDAPQGEPEAVDAGPPARDGSAPAPADGKAGIKVSPPTSASTSESGGTASFTVVLSSKPKGTVVVTIASTKPAEGALDASALTFTAESWATAQTVTVTGVDDPITDGDQPYAIAVGPVQSSDARYAALDPDDVTLTNSDDDVAGLLVSAPSPSPTVNEAGASATFTVHLRAKPVGDVRVPLVVSKPLEAKVEPQELVFTAADYATPKAVVVTGKDDTIADGDQPFTVSLGPVVSAHAAYAGVTSPALAFTNQDDDIAGFLVGSATPTTHTSEAGGAVTVTVRLRSMPAADVTIPVSTNKPSEGAASVASLSFTPADYATPQTITVTGVGDFVDDGDQSYALVLGAASSADAKYQGLDAPDVALTNDDDDTAGVTVSAPTPGSTTSEAGGQVSFTVVLKSQPTSDVTIPVASSNTAEGTVDKASLTFTPADWDTPQTVTVTGESENVRDGDVGYSVTIGKSTSADTAYRDLASVIPLVNADESPDQVATSWGAACARFMSGKMKCWGRGDRIGGAWANVSGSRGDEGGEMGKQLPWVPLPTGRTVKHIEGSFQWESRFCVIFDNDTLSCFGWGGNGALGSGDLSDYGSSIAHFGDAMRIVDLGTGVKARSVSIGYHHACAITDTGKVKCWGQNVSGNLGYGDTISRGANPNEMGDNLPYVNVGTGRTVKKLSVGQTHTCAILDNNVLKCWGNNGYGHLGYGDGLDRGWGPNQMGDNLAPVDLGTGRTAKDISGGLSSTCAILDNDRIKCWGDNDYGQLGYGDTTWRGWGAGQMGDNLPTVDLGPGRTAKSVQSMWFSTCAILDNDSLKCWGFNDRGELGQGDTARRGDNPNEMGAALAPIGLGAGRSVKSLARGVTHNCALLDNGQVKCWGHNDWGITGQGDTTRRGDDPNEMGDNLQFVPLL